MPASLEVSPAIVESVDTEETDDAPQMNKSRVHRQGESLTGRWSNQKALLASVLDSHQENGIHRIEDVKQSEGTLRSLKRLLHDWMAAQAAIVGENLVPVSAATIIHLRPSQKRKDAQRGSTKHDQKGHVIPHWISNRLVVSKTGDVERLHSLGEIHVFR